MVESSRDFSMEMFYRETGIVPGQIVIAPGMVYLDDSVYTTTEVSAPVDIVDRGQENEKPKKDAFSWSPLDDDTVPRQNHEQRGLEERDGWA